jgi:uncharacterized RDD family membrane protein YckC
MEENGQQVASTLIASQHQRTINYLVDYYLQTVITILLFAHIYAFFPQLGTGIMGIVISVVILIAYYLFFETLFQKTPGKFVSKSRVVTATGVRPSFVIILLRTLCRMIPLESISFLSWYPVGWHDKFSGTVVIDETGRKRVKVGFLRSTLILTVDFIVVTAAFFLIILILIFAYIRPVLLKPILKNLPPVVGIGRSALPDLR